MPKVQRKDVPRRLFAHLLLRIQERSINAEALKSLAVWLDTDPEVPAGDWFKRLPGVTVCGKGALVKTFRAPAQSPIGEELLPPPPQARLLTRARP